MQIDRYFFISLNGINLKLQAVVNFDEEFKNIYVFLCINSVFCRKHCIDRTIIVNTSGHDTVA